MLVSDINPFVRTAFKMTIASNSHTLSSRDCRLFFIIGGSGTVLVNNTEYPLSAGTVMLWQSGTIYRFTSSPSLDAAVVCFDYTFDNSGYLLPYSIIPAENLTPTDIVSRQLDFTDAPELNSPMILANCGDMLSAVEDILDETLSPSRYSAEKNSSLLKALIIDILRRRSTFTEFGKIDNHTSAILKHIKANYDGDLSSTALSAALNYHPYYINRMFNTANGISLHHYVINLRITHAEHLLISTDMLVSDISYKVGFKTPINFTNCFKKKNGMSPGTYRKLFSHLK
ncbi:MAG: helix-turn-helix transcriptional regulator [Oscillospiraceae bacterium]|nr:helix-turn-helix transcriptional regulator [Oscillospiraceae bacterium]